MGLTGLTSTSLCGQHWMRGIRKGCSSAAHSQACRWCGNGTGLLLPSWLRQACICWSEEATLLSWRRKVQTFFFQAVLQFFLMHFFAISSALNAVFYPKFCVFLCTSPSTSGSIALTPLLCGIQIWLEAWASSSRNEGPDLNIKLSGVLTCIYQSAGFFSVASELCIKIAWLEFTKYIIFWREAFSCIML